MMKLTDERIRILTMAAYFLVAIVLFGGIGIYLPIWFENIHGNWSEENFVTNTITYYVAVLVTACLDYLLKKIDDNSKEKKLIFLTTVFLNVLILLLTSYLLYQNLANGKHMIGWSIAGVIVTYAVWWVVNFKNESFNASATLGGDPNRTLQNG